MEPAEGEQKRDCWSVAFGKLRRLIDLLAILQKSLDRALFLYIFIHDVRLSGVRASITIVHIRKFYKYNEISFDPDSFLE